MPPPPPPRTLPAPLPPPSASLASLDDDDDVDLLTLLRNLTAHSITVVPEADLVHLLPTLMLTIGSNVASPFLPPLHTRLHSSRLLKQRFLLLRHHPAFTGLPLTLIYSSRAYGAIAPLRTASSSSSRLFSAPPPKTALPVDMVDLQSEDFFHEALFLPVAEPSANTTPRSLLGNPNATPLVIVHPLSNAATLAHVATVTPVARSGMMSVRLAQLAADDAVVLQQCVPVHPPLTARVGDVLLHATTAVALALAGRVWRMEWDDVFAAPVARTADAAPSGKMHGVLEDLRGVFVDREWEGFAACAHHAVAVDKLARSAVGALTAGYVLGLGPRDGLVVSDGEVMWSWIGAVGDVSGRSSGASGGVGSGSGGGVPDGLRVVLKKVRRWDEFVDNCVRAFHVLREHVDEVVAPVGKALAACGVRATAVAEFARGRSTNDSSGDGRKAEKQFRRWLA